ncbi:hypothetical protein HYFRA_00007108 [Hymenoscyphus fraxineus]|uniref:Heterokaryon incompatibility domain-containing protein n=1 Tax=Hymenoscyphus fraxineus TaxID=746836 RepID=A0A9N9KYV2_9HELO|nr:hypothetical protein HYFRA_00007108 [Hymenoscyphus fraxineus]
MEPEAFSYKQLRDERPQFRDDPQKFRLLRLPLDAERYGDIHCELIEAFLDATHAIPYVAVSYRWETGTKTKFIWIGKCKVPVTDGVFSMLDSLRGAEHRHRWDESEFFWIDTLCINQNDDKEKSHQVSHMKEIYTNASVVVVWLGKATKDSDLVMKALTALEYEVPRRKLLPEDPNWALAWKKAKASTLSRVDNEELLDSFYILLSHRWFRRVWVLQEIGNARSAFVLCGNKSISTKYFVMGTKLTGVLIRTPCQSVLRLMPSPVRKGVDNADLFSLLNEFSSAEATEPIDRIFALLGLYSEKTGNGPLCPDYSKPISDSIREVVSHICFCDRIHVPDKLCKNIDEFFSTLKTLDAVLFEHLIQYSDCGSILRFLNKRAQYIGQSFFKTINHQFHPKFDINENTLISIAKNKRIGKDLMQALVPFCKESSPITEDIILGLGGNHVAGLDILRLIAPKAQDWLHIQGEIAMDLWATKHGQEIVTLLYKKFRVHLRFWDESSLDKIKQDLDKRGVLMAILAQRPGCNIKLEDYESVLEIAVSSGHIFVISNFHYSEIQKGYDKPPPRDAFVDHYSGNAVSFERAILDRDVASGTTLTNVNNHTPLNSKNDIERLSSLRAVVAGDIDVLSQLVESGADLEYENEWGESLLALASRGGHTKVVEYLIQKGAALKSRSTAGWTPLHLAVGQGHVDIVRVLLAHGTPMNIQSSNGWIPLHLATWQGHINIVSILLEHGANPTISIDGGKWLPMNIAVWRGYFNIALLLEGPTRLSKERKQAFREAQAVARRHLRESTL